MSEIFRRFRSMGESEKLAEDGKIRLLASTDDAVNWGGWREILSHAEGAIEMSAARSLLVNHDPDQLAGGISGMQTDGRQLFSDAEIDEDARMRSGVSVRKQVAKGRLNGVSIGYTYDRADTDFDEKTRTMTVKKWRLLEVSLTPIPADSRAQVRSLPFPHDTTPIVPVSETAAPAASQNERTAMSDPIKPQENAPAAVSNNDEGVRAAVMAEQREVAQLAESVGLRAADFIGKPKSVAQDAMMRALAEKNKTKEPESHVAPQVTVQVDSADKARSAAVGAILHRANVPGIEVDKNNPLRGRGMLDIVRGYARMTGERGCDDWNRTDLAWFALGRPEMISGRAANVTTSSFTSFVFLDAINKATHAGYEMGASSVKFQPLVSTQRVADFKTYRIGGLSAGNLTKTAENAPFPELDKAEGVYSNALKMWGGTMSLSLQALVSDDTAQFERNLRMAGVIALKTVDKRVFQKLLMGTSSDEATSTWTSNTSSSSGLTWTTADTAAAARALLDKPCAALMTKTGLDGNPTGNMAKYLVCSPTIAGQARALVAGPGPGAPTQQKNDLEVIVTPWLSFSGLAGYSTTTYYVVADPNEVSGLILTYLNGMDSIQTMEYDAGAVAARNWKLFLPFEADLHYETVGGTATIAGAQQGVA